MIGVTESTIRKDSPARDLVAENSPKASERFVKGAGTRAGRRVWGGAEAGWHQKFHGGIHKYVGGIQTFSVGFNPHSHRFGHSWNIIRGRCRGRLRHGVLPST